MNRSLIVFVFASVLSIGEACAAKTAMHSIEDAIESDAKLIKLPDQETGSLYFRECSSCNLDPLQLTPESKFYLNGAEVDLATLNRRLKASSSAQLTIMHTPGKRTVTRIVAFAE